MRLPHFSHAQQGVILLLGAALLCLWAWRANFFLAPSPPPVQNLNLVFVEVIGAAAHPGVYSFDHAPTLAEAWRRAGGSAPAPAGGTRLTSGTRLTINQAGGYQLGRMSGPQLLTLGLALDLNSATAQDLDALPGIGPALAKRITDYREQHGPFKKIADLLEVSGIGPQNLEKLKPHLLLGSGSPELAAPPGQEPAVAPEKPGSGAQMGGDRDRERPGKRGATPPRKAPGRVLDPNRASQKDLEGLPGIGPVLAKRIVDYRRRHGPFRKIGDLEQVSGIGPKKLEKIKPYVVINGPGPVPPDH